MSRGNVEIVRRIHAAEARRDSATMLELYDPQVEVDNTHSPTHQLIGGTGIYRGHDGLRALFREWYEAWENVDSAVEELIDAGEQVVSVLSYRGRGRASGAEVAFPQIGVVWTLRDGRVTRTAFFGSRGEALAAAGPAAAAPSPEPGRVETLRAVYDEWSRGNLTAGLDLFDPDVLFIPRKDVPDPGPYLGPDAVKEFLRGWLASWTNFTMVGEEFIEAGDSVVVAVRPRGSGKESGAVVEESYFQVWTFRGAAVIRVQHFLERAEALEAVGLGQ